MINLITQQQYFFLTENFTKKYPLKYLDEQDHIPKKSKIHYKTSLIRIVVIKQIQSTESSAD